MLNFLKGLYVVLLAQGLFWMPIQDSAAALLKQPLKFSVCKDCR